MRFTQKINQQEMNWMKGCKNITLVYREAREGGREGRREGRRKGRKEGGRGGVREGLGHYNYDIGRLKTTPKST